MRQLVSDLFISNNCASFYLLWQEKLVKHQKVSKYYENDCRLGHLLWKSSQVINEFKQNNWTNQFHIYVLGNRAMLVAFLLTQDDFDGRIL